MTLDNGLLIYIVTSVNCKHPWLNPAFRIHDFPVHSTADGTQRHLVKGIDRDSEFDVDFFFLL